MDVRTELQQYMDTIKDFSKDMGQDAQALHEYLIKLTNYMARANAVMAEYKYMLRVEKEAAYRKLIASSHSQEKYFAPSLAKDYVDSQCSETAFTFDLAERLSRLCYHTIDAIRTVVSSLKSERVFSHYQQ